MTASRILAMLLNIAAFAVLLFPVRFVFDYPAGHLAELVPVITPFLLVAGALFVAAWRIRKNSPADSIHRR